MTIDEIRKRERRQAVLLGALLRGLQAFWEQAAARSSDAALFRDWRSEFAQVADADLLDALIHSSDTAEATTGDDHQRELIGLLTRAADLASFTLREHESPSFDPSIAPVSDRIELETSAPLSNRRFPLRALTATAMKDELPIFANTRSTEPNVSTYLNQFRVQLDRLRQHGDWQSFDCVYTHLLNLLQSWGWCLPSGRLNDAPDVSLYDHLRVTSAIAACLYDCASVNGEAIATARINDAQPYCLLLTGDISGIQDYIFDISTTGAGGVAKRLRARSFFVQLLSDAASLRILSDFDLPLANLLMASGGNFYVLLPNLPGVITGLNALQKEFDEKLLAEFHGALAINLAWREMAADDFAPGRYSEVLAHLNGKLQHRKLQRLSKALRDKNGWRSAFTPEQPVGAFARETFAGDSVCKACYRFPATERSDKKLDEPDICKQCEAQRELGRQLTKAKYVAFFKDPKQALVKVDESAVHCLGMSVIVDRRFDTARHHTAHLHPYLVVKLNDPDLRELARVPAAFRYLANHIPLDTDGSALDFSRIAASAKRGNGDDQKQPDNKEDEGGLLGVLKADVDYLGLIFQEGLRRDSGAGFDTVSRIAALSRQMDWFFSGWLEWHLSQNHEKCYTVYSGGDDLLVVGPRAETLELAREVREAFRRYTNNRQVTLSAGLAVVRSRLPLAHTVKQANSALKRAKEAGRNGLGMLGEVVQWDELERLDESLNVLRDSDAPSALIYRLLQFSTMYREFQKSNDVRSLRCIPLLAETLARNVDRRKQPNLFEWAHSLLNTSIQNIGAELSFTPLLLAVRWLILERREA